MDNQEQVQQIIQMTKMVGQRDEIYNEHTHKIFNVLQDNVIAAFNDLLDLPSDDIDWNDIQIETHDDHDQIVLYLTIAYYKEQANDFIMNIFHVEHDEEPNEQLIRIVKFGLPLPLVAFPKQQIIEFIVNSTDAEQYVNMEKLMESSSKEQHKPIDLSFNLDELTPDQRQRMVLYKKGVMH